MASNELGLFLADFVAPTNMATDIAAESLVQAVKVNSPSSHHRDQLQHLSGSFFVDLF